MTTQEKIRKQLEIYIKNNNNDFDKVAKIIKEKYDAGVLTGVFEIPTAEGAKYIFYYRNGVVCEFDGKEYGKKVVYDEEQKLDNLNIERHYVRLDALYEYYPPAFEDMLQSLKDGQVVTFNNGNTYAVAVTKKKLLLKPVYQNENIEKIEMGIFRKERPITCDLTRIRESEYKSLYKELTQGKILNATLRWIDKEDIAREVKELEKKLKKSETHSVRIGDNRFYVKNTLIGPVWYGESGKRLSKKYVTYVLAYAQTAPVTVEIHQDDDSKTDVLLNDYLIESIGQMVMTHKKHDLENVYNIMDFLNKELPKENDFQLIIKSIIKDNDDYQPIKFVFKKQGEYVTGFGVEAFVKFLDENICRNKSIW